MIVGASILFPLLVLTLALVEPRHYTAVASFTPQTGQSMPPSGLASLAGQFGVSIPGDEPAQSPQFYADLLTSREILDALADDTFSIADTLGFSPRGRIRAPLADIQGIDSEETAPRVRRQKVIEWLQDDAISVSTDRETTVVQLSVSTSWPDLSQQVSVRLLDLVNQFNLKTRQSKAASERRFIERRMDDAREELRTAEDDLETFLRNNRQFRNSPELVFQRDRLQRQVTMRQELYTSLAQSYEQARIDEVRNTPVITVVERPQEPVLADSRRLVLMVLVGVAFGVMVGVAAAFVREYVRRSREDDELEYEELSTLWQDAKRDVKKVLMRFHSQENKRTRADD